MKMQAPSSWTPERVDLLKQLVSKRLFYSDIAERLGVTKNACIGKAQRLGLGGEMTKQEQQMRARIARQRNQVLTNIKRRKRSRSLFGEARRPAKVLVLPRLMEELLRPPPAPPPEQIIELPPLNLSILDVPNKGCKYPVTEDRPHLFCGNKQKPGSSFCAFHHQVCWRRAA